MQIYISKDLPPTGTGDNGILCVRDLTAGLGGSIGWAVGAELVIAAAALSVALRTSVVATSGAIALTLAAGAYVGQEKLVTMKTDGGDATLTPVAMNGGTTITLNDVGDSVLLCYDGLKWNIVANTGCTVA